ncbi:FxsA family protein [Arsenicicoccus sp. oral taxon 190]|uniref:FxsA family protein n=1 Tax=Arsenicicoccus sp. oral taxon 190 TaxID=1658671 RepID=UPI00067A383A|nr:FxsA family protein [Arsenicicoccus sp. oral taxon 190]AKT51888.1 hypothetical protein ADJ73_12485 [Arsenicicoccus sp. oral taxon 190]
MSTPTRHRSRWPALVLVLLVVVPVVEVAVIIAVGKVIGGWPTVAALLLLSALGAYLLKREGRAAWRALQEAIASGRMPAGELSDGALVLVGGTLLLAPGFVTDALGLLCLLPVTRRPARTLLTRVVTRRLLSSGPGVRVYRPYAGGPPHGQPPTFGRPPTSGADGRTGPQRPDDDIIEGEIL